MQASEIDLDWVWDEESGTLEFWYDSVVISGKLCLVSGSGLYKNTFKKVMYHCRIEACLQNSELKKKTP